MNINDFVMIVDVEEYNRQAAEIISINNDDYTVKVLSDNKEITLKQHNLKLKKVCVCGQTARGPWCDGSHARH